MTEQQKKQIYLNLEKIRLKHDQLFHTKLKRFFQDEAILLIAKAKAGYSSIIELFSIIDLREIKLINLLLSLYESCVKDFYIFQHNLLTNTKASFKETISKLREKVTKKAQDIISYSKEKLSKAFDAGRDIIETIKVVYMFPGRIIKIARTEVNTASNIGMHEAAEFNNKNIKMWISRRDDRVRESHVLIDGEEQPMDSYYSNGCLYPGDPDGPPKEVINCRCFQIFR